MVDRGGRRGELEYCVFRQSPVDVGGTSSRPQKNVKTESFLSGCAQHRYVQCTPASRVAAFALLNLVVSHPVCSLPFPELAHSAPAEQASYKLAQEDSFFYLLNYLGSSLEGSSEMSLFLGH